MLTNEKLFSRGYKAIVLYNLSIKNGAVANCKKNCGSPLLFLFLK